MKSTNYYNAFISAAEDCPAKSAEVPAQKGDSKTIAKLHFDMIAGQPYRHTSDDVVFSAFAAKNGITGSTALREAREQFFAKGQPCLRCSPLGKRYGWGIHSNAEGRVALYAVESPEYKKLLADDQLQHVKAMRSKRG